MARLGLETKVQDRAVYDRTVERFSQANIALPTFAQLAEPGTISPAIRSQLTGVAPDAPDPLNLFRVHWHNGPDRKSHVDTVEHLVLPKALTGVDSPVVVAIGAVFPMIRAHKVLAAYGCLVPRIVTGQFDPTRHRAIWPSTGNYCRGGVAISRIMRCRGVAVLPEKMSQERFDWLGQWISDPDDVVRTPGSESNVKEIYDKCAELERDPSNVILNQFCEFGNHLAHLRCTGAALARLFEQLGESRASWRLRAFVSSTGSAGTLAAGDHLKDVFGSKTIALEALECPTLLRGGFGEHNIQGIGDKHVPFIHNVYNTDLVAAVSDRSTDALAVLFNTEVGRDYLQRRHRIPSELVQRLGSFGLSGIANVLGAIKVAKYYGFGPDDVIMTVATDGMELYTSELEKTRQQRFGGEFTELDAAEVWGQHLAGTTTDNLLELRHEDRERLFNLGYFTWVEQQGIEIDAFVARRQASFWRALRDLVPVWDDMITEFNGRTGVLARLSS